MDQSFDIKNKGPLLKRPLIIPRGGKAVIVPWSMGLAHFQQPYRLARLSLMLPSW